MKNNKIKKRAHKLYILSLIYYFLFLEAKLKEKMEDERK
jgi:hypothetical protein